MAHRVNSATQRFHLWESQAPLRPFSAGRFGVSHVRRFSNVEECILAVPFDFLRYQSVSYFADTSHLPRFIYKIIAKQSLCEGARDPLLGGLNRNKPPMQRLCAKSKRLQPSDSKADPLAEILVDSTHMLNALVLCSRATRSSQLEKRRIYKQQQKV